jgi:methionine--tRNA ligase beta chain
MSHITSGGSAMISFDEWKKAELKTAVILEAEDIEGRDKLYKLKISLGDEERTLVAGIKPAYSKEELKGKTIIVVANLEPAKISGTESQGMLLAVKSKSGDYTLITTDSEAEAGTKVE